jgi:hypothetical protein
MMFDISVSCKGNERRSSSMSLEISSNSRATRLAVLAAFAELALTSLHHAYGALIYSSPWRLEVVGISVIVAALIAGLSVLAHRQRGTTWGQVWFAANMVVVVAFPIVAIGLFEGAYNHVAKNIVHLMGNAALYARMFPATMYEAPGDWIFEITGIAQFPVALVALWWVVVAVAGRWSGRQVVAANRSSNA